MEKIQICSICRKNIAHYICYICGKSVCENCFENSMCVSCKIGKRIREKRK